MTNLKLILINSLFALTSRPQISVVVPTYDRHTMLSNLMRCLGAQTFRSFEVVIVDQTDSPWPDRDRDFGITIKYVRSSQKGICTARNLGANLSRAKIIAFTDDDCEPPNDWLRAAFNEFADSGVMGLEGLIESDRYDDPDWRPVTNRGVEGIGFMGANTFTRREIFHAVGGFDPQFENPSFREDTDFGWRVQAMGKIKFSDAARIYHPPLERSLARESLAARSALFVNDAKLLKKWPERYVQLFLVEAQWRKNPHFWKYFLEGMRRENVELPQQIQDVLNSEAPTEADAHQRLVKKKRQL